VLLDNIGKSGPSPTEKFQWATNAPADWPPVFCQSLNPKGMVAENELRMAGSLDTAFEGVPSSGLKMAAFQRKYIDWRGILDVPLEIEQSGVRYPTFLYTVPDQAAADHFYAVYQYFSARGMYPIYYAPTQLPQAASEVNPFREFHPDKDFKKYKGPEPTEIIAMWWPIEGNEKVTGSQWAQDCDRMMKALDGISSYFMMYAYRSFTGKELETRMELPDKFSTLYGRGPEENLIVMSASKEKGIGFHFPVQSTSPAYRDIMTYLIANWAESLRLYITQNNIKMDPSEMKQYLGHWESMMKVIGNYETQKGEKIGQIGIIVLP
jgi:hypothetical protein